jgi:ribonuclease R
VAKFLSDAEAPAAYRVHEPPAAEDLRATLPVLRELQLVDAPLAARVAEGDPHAIQDVLRAARGTTGEFLANSVLLRAQRRAVYLPRNEGHYALGAPAYCHFTSPIRRYPDDIVHRSLRAVLEGRRTSREQMQVLHVLPQLCNTCSERERLADGAERDTQNVKMAELYKGHVGESFSGIVVGVERYGLFVMLDDTCAEGLVPVRSLGDEWFDFDEKRMCLTGGESGRQWRPGQRVAVTVTDARPERGQIDFGLARGRDASK